MFVKVLLILSLTSLSAQAAFQEAGDPDVLIKVRNKLTEINDRIKDHRVSIKTESFKWPEFENFNQDLMLAVAHDPGAGKQTDIPQELQPVYLSQRLRTSWTKLEESVFTLGNLIHSEQWAALKTDMDQFLQLRDQFLYQPARAMLKNGQLKTKLQALRLSALEMLKAQQPDSITNVRVMDPVMDKLSAELTTLNQSVGMLEELRKPKPVENTSIFQEKHYYELSLFGAGAFILAAVTTSFVFLIFQSIKRSQAEKAPKPVNPQFDYSEWLKRLEKSLVHFKKIEENHTEDIIKLINYSHDLAEARKGLNQADGEHAYYASMENLNSTAAKIEEYFSKINLKKNTEASRNMVRLLVELCEAIEKGKDMKGTTSVVAKVVPLRVA